MTENPPASTIARCKLDAFLAENDDLEALAAHLSAFNLFHVLRIEHAEIRHSNVLAWLLTPYEPHGLGDTFLRRFVSRLLLEHESAADRLTPAEVELMDLSAVEVQRESMNIDVLVRHAAGNWCLLIENKVRSNESEHQLRRYVERVEQAYPGCEIIGVYMTLEGDDPSDEGQQAGFVPFIHAEVLSLLERVITQKRSQIPPDAATFLDHYIQVLRKLTMQDTELVDLCKRIYRKHRDAIDLIVEYGTSSRIVEAYESQTPKTIDCEFVSRHGRYVFFVPREMGRHMPDVPLADWSWLPRPVPVACWFLYSSDSGKLRLIMEVGPDTDWQRRHRLLDAIKAAGFKFQEKSAYRRQAKFTRFLAESVKLRKNENAGVDDHPDYIGDVVSKLWKRFWQEGQRIVPVLESFQWDSLPPDVSP